VDIFASHFNFLYTYIAMFRHRQHILFVVSFGGVLSDEVRHPGVLMLFASYCVPYRLPYNHRQVGCEDRLADRGFVEVSRPLLPISLLLPSGRLFGLFHLDPESKQRVKSL
jgi:hypothetical protein